MDNPDLQKPVEPDSEMKNWLVEYVGNTLAPEDGLVTVEHIIEVMAKEFPDFLMCVAEENFIRGYQQALNDAEEGEKLLKEHQEKENNA